MISIKNGGRRAVVANTAEGIKVIRPGKSESFAQEPHNLAALRDVQGVKVTGKAEASEPSPQPEPTRQPANSLPADPVAPTATPTTPTAPAEPVKVVTPAQPSAAVSPAAAPAAGSAPAAGGKAPAKGVQPPSAPPSGGTA